MFNIKTDNKKLKKVISRVSKNKKLHTYWVCSNINAIDRMGIHDHGETHISIVVDFALNMLDNLRKYGIKSNIERDFKDNPNIKQFKLDYEDSEIVVFLAATLHDVGMAIHRDDHDILSIPLAMSLIEGFLKDLYDEEQLTIMTSEILHCIRVHRSDSKSFTIEGSLLRIADALDMKKGRAKIAYEHGTIDTHSISALAIEDVKIASNEKYPILINIEMSNSAGLFHVEELLKSKILGTPLERYVDVNVFITRNDDDSMNRLFFRR